MSKSSILWVRLKKWYKKPFQVWKSDIIYITFLFLLVCIFFWPVLLHPDQLLYFGDVVYAFYPWDLFAQSMFKEGQLPLWLPYGACGEPFVATIETAMFYPPNLVLFLVFPANLALGYGYLFHTFLAGFFMFSYMRYLKLDRGCSFLSSIIFIYSGFFLANAISGHYTMISAACWLPLIFLLFEIALKKTSVVYGMLTGVSIGLQLLAGHTQILFLTLVALGLYLIFRSVLSIKENRAYKKVAQFFAISILAVGVGVCLAAIQLLPTYEFSKLTTRAGGVDYDFATTYSFPRENLITLILPNFFGNYFQYWGIGRYEETAIYIGIFPLILITIAIFFKRSGNEEQEWIWFFTGLAILSMLLALGKNTRIYWWVWRLVPGVNLFRAPSRFRFLVTFSAAILAGYGFGFLKGELTSYERQKVQQIIKVLVLLLALMVSEILIFQDELIFRAIINSHSLRLLASIILQPIDRMRYYINSGYFPQIIVIIDWFCLVIFSLCSIILLFLRVKPKFTFKYKFVNQYFYRLKKRFNSIVILFVLANLWLFHIGFISTRNPSDIFIEPDYIEFLQNNAENYRVYDVSCNDVDCGFKGDIPANSHIIYGIHDVRSYNPLKLEAYMDVLSCIHPLSNNTNHPILNLLNVKYILTTTPLTNSGFELVFTQQEEQYNAYIYENKQVLPKAFVLHEIKLISKNDVIRELKRASFNPLDAVLLELHSTSESLGNAAIEGFEPAEIHTYSPNEIIITTTLTHPGYLVLGENHYPGWKVYVDGAQKEIQKAYHTLRAVYLETGSHEVRFTYEPASLRRGAWITGLTALFLVGTISMKRFLHLKLFKES